MQKVTVAIGPDKGRVFTLREGAPLVIGRRKSHLLMADHNVSRRHAQFVAKDGKWYIVDLGSTNGTFVNGTRITEPTLLKAADQIQMGRSILVFHGAPTTGRKSRPEAPAGAAARRPAPAARQDTDSVAYDAIAGKSDPQMAEQLGSLEVYLREGAKPPQRQPRPQAPATLSRRPDDAPPPATSDRSENKGPRPRPVANNDAPAGPPTEEQPPTLRVSQRPPDPEEAEPLRVDVEPSPPPPEPTTTIEAAATDEPPKPIGNVEPGDDQVADDMADDAAPGAASAADEAALDEATFDAVTTERGDDEDIEVDVASTPDDAAPERPRGDVAQDDADGARIDADDTDGSADTAGDEPPHLAAADNDASTELEPLGGALSEDDPQDPGESAVGYDDEDGWIDLDDGVPSDDSLRHLASPTTGAWESPFKLRDDDGGAATHALAAGATALAVATTIERGSIQPAADGLARPAEEMRAFALAVDAEPTVRVAPPEEEDPFEDEPTPRLPPADDEEQAGSDEDDVVETEAVATVETVQPPAEEETEPEPEPEPDFELNRAIDDEDDHGRSSLVYEAEQAAVEFDTLRQPAEPQAPAPPPQPSTGKQRPELPSDQIAIDEDEHEEYDYYAWEERQRQATRRRVKVAGMVLGGVLATALVVSQVTVIWMQVVGNEPQPAPAPAPTPPAQQAQTEPPPPVPSPDDPEAREQNMQDVYAAMKRHTADEEQQDEQQQ